MDIKPSLNKYNIFKIVSDGDIFNFYCNHFNENKFHSEFRSDSKPSATINKMPNGEYMYKDFGNKDAFDCFKYVMKKYNIGFLDALIKINKDMNLGLGWFDYRPNLGSSSKKSEKKDYRDTQKIHLSKTIIKVKYRDTIQDDINYWTGRFCIPINLLNRYNNYAIKFYDIIKPDNSFRIEPNDICYTQNYYIDNTGVLRRKIYRPYGNDFKWMSNITSLVIQGIKHLPKHGDVLIITKSMKDLLVFIYLGFEAVIATNNETTFIPPKVLTKLKKRFKKIFINYDNDKTGLEMAENIASIYNLTKISTPYNKYKDVSDHIEQYGEKETKQYFKEIIYGE